MVLSDQPIQPGSHVKAYSHLVTESPMAVYACEALAEQLSADFPRSLHDKPFLLQGKKSIIRQQLMGWFNEVEVQPDVVAEFDDSALMQAFAQQGLGAFAAPLLLETQLLSNYRLLKVGVIHRVTERFYAISPERKLTHPAVLQLVKALQQDGQDLVINQWVVKLQRKVAAVVVCVLYQKAADRWPDRWRPFVDKPD